MKTALLFSILIFSSLFAAKNKKSDEMKGALDTLAYNFSVMYAPVEWKQNWSGWDLAKELALAKEKVENNPDMPLKDFQRLVRQFVGSTQDYHVGVRFFSTEWATLPLRIKGAEGRYFISSIDRRELPVSDFSFQVGDEVLYFDGLPVGEQVNKLQAEEFSSTTSETDRALAEIFLTTRAGRLGHFVPKGDVSLKIRRKGKEKVSETHLSWVYHSEKILPPPYKSLASFSNPFEDKEFISPLAASLDSLGTLIGKKKSFVPLLGNTVWQAPAKGSFHAYIFLTDEGNRVGYIRIPRYACGVEEADEFARLIDVMNSLTSALIIDQVDNPGGSVLYLYTLAALLTPTPLEVPMHRCTLTQGSISHALEEIEVLKEIETDEEAVALFGESLYGYPLSHDLLQTFIASFHRDIYEWNQGHVFTDPLYLYGIDKIMPHPEVNYSGPILMLINSLDFSGGDFLPAILQDNKRATLFGSRTAGAGGYVLKTEFYNHFGIDEIRLTGSIATRLNDQPIENLGVTPDIPYEITPYDLENDYANYKKAVLKAVGSLIK